MIVTFIYGASIIVTIILTSLVLIQGVKDKVNLYFSLFLFSVIGWIGSLYLFYTIEDPNLVLFIGRFNFVVTILLMTLVFYFSYFFPRVTLEIKRIFKLTLWMETLLLSLITFFTPLVDKEEIISGDSRITVYGPLYFLFIAHFVFYFIASIYLLYQKHKKLEGKEKSQIRYVFFGLLSSLLFGSITNIFIPLFTGFYDSQNLGVLSPVILAAFVAYAIRKHRLLDIKVIAAEMLTFVIWGTLAIKIFVSHSPPLFYVDLVILILTVIFGILLIKKCTEMKLNKGRNLQS
jgi:hypothetical protein